MNEESIFNNIKTTIDSLNLQITHQYSLPKLKNINPSKENTSSYDADEIVLKNRLAKAHKETSNKKNIDDMKKYKPMDELNISPSNENQLLDDINQHENPDKVVKLSWKKLNKEIKLQKFTEYMEKTNYKNFPQILYDKLVKMINEDKIDKKKYVIYNEDLS